MKGCIIKVTPEVLNSVSADTLQKVDKAQNVFQEIASHVGKMPGRWEGEGSDRMRAAFDSHKDDYEQIFRALREHINNLQLIAAGYTEGEKVAIDISNVLPDDVIY